MIMGRPVWIRVAHCLLALSVCASTSLRGGEQVSSRFKSLAARIAGEEVGRAEIVYLPSRILTRARLTPEMLDEQYRYKLVIRDLRGDRVAESLLKAVRGTRVEPTDGAPEVR